MPVAKSIPDHAPDPKTVLAALWRDAGFDDAALDDVRFDRRRAGAAVVVCGRNGGAGDDRGGGAGGG